ncbi:MAG: ABC-type transport auxiliary lipoprotein family protein [Legionellaceae bacterium]|nr:ABC-type transport auxiliary lipoprotein family protein [Legionellaceae bacterium]
MTKKLMLIACGLSVASCTPMQRPITQHYAITTFYHSAASAHPQHACLYINKTQALSSLSDSSMFYISKPYTLMPFAHNAWIMPPAEMISPLLTRSVQDSHIFRAVTSDTSLNSCEYRLDSTLLTLQQDFRQKPSTLQLSVSITLVSMSQNRLIASQVFQESVPCPKDSPLGGAIAANIATEHLTRDVSQFIRRTLTH